MLPVFMSRQIVKSQDRLLLRFLTDPSFVEKAARHESHACISEWADGINGKVLELGCGPGKYVALLNSLGFEVVGVDPFEFPSWQIIREHTSADLRDGIYAEKLPFQNGHFDHAVCLGALLYFEQPEASLHELRRVVRPGGRLILRTVNKSNLYTRRTGKKIDPASKNLYDMNELAALVSQTGFRIDRTFSYGFWPPFLTDLMWYLQCVWLPLEVQHALSLFTRPQHHINNVVFATCI